MLDNVKKAAVKAVEATNPVNVLYGTVEKAKPLEIRIHEKLKLTEEFLDVAEHLTRHERIVTIEHEELAVRELGDKKEADFLDTDDKAAPVTKYKHSYVKMVFEDGLKKGDKVVLLRVQGGHRFLVIDRYKRGEDVWSYQ
ncbi:DUF2577 domain-containing protein [Cytobacillus firmus]|uniref:DUF2577 domain-containing protein n=1 Tax=Cytobacillus firmus TaxID=1399 RepID=UPI0018CE01F2|nr:DUF2577 domain-containing protein [Cytobacillus firmus]MBG9657813.1 hypothetical protein [Cytobacillus firmus]MED1904815.1 DUF2577 domain-containing protein [Cytobacillus firmus]